ncbi:MAG: GAF domain-containing sensor histidine kinase, partial [Dehalococcoidia bacterium]
RIRVLFAVANGMGTLLENARKEEALRESEGQHRRLSERLTSFNRIIRASTSRLDLQTILSLLSSEAPLLLPHDRVSIALADPAGQTATIYAVAGQTSPGDVGTIIPISGSIAGRVIKSGKANNMPDVEQEDNFSVKADLLAMGLRSGISVPLWKGGVCFGSLNFTSFQVGKYGPEEIELAQEIANQVALAVLNAQYYQDAQRLAVAEERNRIAREIHDTLIQGFTGIILQLNAAELALREDSSAFLDHVGRAKDLAGTSLQEARRAINDMPPQALVGRSLEAALENEVGRFPDAAGHKASFALCGQRRDLPSELQVALFRVCQEALTNIRRHAEATEVWVELTFYPESVGLVVKDNGIGFDVDAVRASDTQTSFGLVGMERRVQVLGGTFTVGSQKGEGTQVDVKLPVQ